MRLRVTATNEVGEASASSDPTAPVAGITPSNTAPPPEVSGIPEDGQSLTADPGSWSGSEPISHAYQWRRCDATGGNCADIAGATAQSYELASADVGFTILVEVTASNVAGQASAASAATAVVLPQ